jgi:hypothetical protein
MKRLAASTAVVVVSSGTDVVVRVVVVVVVVAAASDIVVEPAVSVLSVPEESPMKDPTAPRSTTTATMIRAAFCHPALASHHCFNVYPSTNGKYHRVS